MFSPKWLTNFLIFFPLKSAGTQTTLYLLESRPQAGLYGFWYNSCLWKIYGRKNSLTGLKLNTIQKITIMKKKSTGYGVCKACIDHMQTRFTKYLVISNYFYFNQRWGRFAVPIMDQNNFLLNKVPASENLKVGYFSQFRDNYTDECRTHDTTLLCVANQTAGLVLKTTFNESFS